VNWYKVGYWVDVEVEIEKEGKTLIDTLQVHLEEYIQANDIEEALELAITRAKRRKWTLEEVHEASE